jgi:predicted RNA-binding protein associated with RNAse of E/G family
LGLRVSKWLPRPGRVREDFYIDLVDIDPDFGDRTGSSGRLWRVVDLYLDILVYAGERLEVLDTNELLAAMQSGLIAAGTAQRALERLYRTVEGITRHGYDIGAWLRECGVELVWRDR